MWELKWRWAPFYGQDASANTNKAPKEGINLIVSLDVSRENEM